MGCVICTLFKKKIIEENSYSRKEEEKKRFFFLKGRGKSPELKTK